MEGNLGFSGSVGPGEPILRPMAAGDLPAVIELHRRLFPTASGRVFLAKSYYPAMLDPRSTGFAFVEIDSGKVAGFLAGALDSRAWHRILVRRNIAGSLIAAVRVAFSGWSDLPKSCGHFDFCFPDRLVAREAGFFSWASMRAGETGALRNAWSRLRWSTAVHESSPDAGSERSKPMIR